MPESVFIFGASGHAKVVIDALTCGRPARNILLVDDAAQTHGGQLLGHRVKGGRNELICGPVRNGIIAIGDNAARLAIADWLRQNGFGFVTAVHPAAVVAASATLGPGTVVMANVVVNADARVGSHVILNTGASVDHDCVVEDGAHIAPGCRLCGGVTVGRGAFVGAGTVVAPSITIGANAVIGAGSTVLTDMPAGVWAAGSPCRLLERTT